MTTLRPSAEHVVAASKWPPLRSGLLGWVTCKCDVTVSALPTTAYGVDPWQPVVDLFQEHRRAVGASVRQQAA